MDFLTVVTANFAFLYVFVVFHHGRRKVLHLATTYSPSMDWVIQQLREATPFGERPRFMFRDNDRIYGQGVRTFLGRCGIEEVRTSFRSPWQNPFAERVIGSIRRECLDHVIVLNEAHLKRILKDYFGYYHQWRTHLSLNMDCPESRPVQPAEAGQIIEFPEVNGLHHHYERCVA
jgi:hypothetical protein